MAKPLVIKILADPSQAERGFRRASRSAALWNSEIVRSTRGAVAATVGFGGLGRSVAFASAAFVGTAGLATAVRQSVSAFLEFQDTMQKSVGLAGVAQGEIGKLTAQVLKLAPAVGVSPQELAKALYFITSSGIPASEAMGVLAQSAKAAVSGLGDVQTVADAVTSAMNAYSASGLSASDATNVLVNAVKFGKGEADTLASSIGNVAAVASQMGVSFKDVGAGLAIVTQLGIDAQTASVELQQIFTNLLKVTPQAADAFKSVGISAEGLRKTFAQKGLEAGLREITTAFKGNAAALNQAFPNIRAFRGVLALAGGDAKKTAAIYREFGSTLATATKTAFGAISRSPEQRIRQLSAAVEVLKIRIGAALLPTVQGLIKRMAVWLSNTQNQEAVTRTLSNVVGTLAAAIKRTAEVASTIAHAFGGWKTAITLAIGAWAGFKAAGIGSAVAIEAANIAAAFGVSSAWKAALILTGWGALAIAAGAAAAYVITHWSQVKSFFERLGRFMVDVFKAAWTGIKGIFDLGVYQALLPVEALSRGLAKALGWIPGLGGKIKGALNSVTSFIEDFRRSGIAHLQQAGEQMGQAWSDAFVKQVQAASSALETAASPGRQASRFAPPDTKTGTRAKGSLAASPFFGSGSGGAAAAKSAVDKGFTLPFNLLLAQAKADATTSTKDDLKVAKEIRAKLIQVIPTLTGTKLIDALGLLGETRQKIKSAAEEAGQFTVPPKLQLEQAKLEALGKPIRAVILKVKAAAEKAIRSGNLGIQGQIDAWNAITDANNQLANQNKSALNGFKQASTRALVSGLNLSREQSRALRARLSQLGPGGTVPSLGVGAFGVAFAGGPSTGVGIGRPLVVESNVNLNMDSKAVAKSTTRQQIKDRRRNPAQRRGPGAGGFS